MALNALHGGLLRASRIAATIGGLGLLCIAIVVTADVFLRHFANITLGGATEISGFIFAIATALAYPYVLMDRANVRIDVAYAHLPSRTRAILDLVGLVLLLYFIATLTYWAYFLLAKSWSLNSMSVGVVSIPLWIPQGIWVIGYLLFSLTVLFLIVYVLISLLRRDWDTVNRIAGMPSIEETIEEETYADSSGVQDTPISSADKEKN